MGRRQTQRWMLPALTSSALSRRMVCPVHCSEGEKNSDSSKR